MPRVQILYHLRPWPRGHPSSGEPQDERQHGTSHPRCSVFPRSARKNRTPTTIKYHYQHRARGDDFDHTHLPRYRELLSNSRIMRSTSIASTCRACSADSSGTVRGVQKPAARPGATGFASLLLAARAAYAVPLARRRGCARANFAS